MKVLVVTIGGMHMAYLGCYGNQWVDTPTFDRLAAEGVVFDQHYADRPDAAGAGHAWRTGRYWLPSTAKAGERQADAEDFLHVLSAQRIRTCLVIGADQARDSQFVSGWDAVRRVPSDGDGSPLERAVNAARTCLRQLKDVARWLLWVDLPSLSPPWNWVPADYFQGDDQLPPSDDLDDEESEYVPLKPCICPTLGPVDANDDETILRLQRTYSDVVGYLDAELGRLLELSSLEAMEDVLFIITASHGLPLGEHGIVGAVRPWLHEELVHVPLLMQLPGRQKAGLRISALTQSVDLMPTVLDWFGIRVPESVQGRSVLPLVRGESNQVRPYACSGLCAGDATELALRTPEWALLLPSASQAGDPPRGRQLFVKPDDRWEVNNVVQHHLELADGQEHTLRCFVEATLRPGPLQPPGLPALAAASAPAIAPEEPS